MASCPDRPGPELWRWARPVDGDAKLLSCRNLGQASYDRVAALSQGVPQGVDVAMKPKRPPILLLWTVALAAVAAAAPAKEAKRPKQTGRLAVTINRVGPKTPVGQPVELRSRVRWSGGPARFLYEWSSVSGPPLPGVGDLCVVKVQVFQVDQSFQVLQASVGDVGTLLDV